MIRQIEKDPPGRTAWAGKVALWILMLTVALLFGSISLLFLATHRSGQLTIPSLFFLSTLILGASSLLLHLGLRRTAQGDYRRWLGAAMLLGVIFLVSQGWAWYELYGAGLYMQTDRGAAFLYLLTGLHGLHIVGGLLFLRYVWMPVPQRTRYLEMAVFFWDFLGVLWCYLLGLLMLNL
ncbi:MAG: hypothetical protein OHK0039_20490 [Bacteroidia bacterium]